MSYNIHIDLIGKLSYNIHIDLIGILSYNIHIDLIGKLSYNMHIDLGKLSYNRIGGTMARVLASCTVDRGFEPGRVKPPGSNQSQ